MSRAHNPCRFGKHVAAVCDYLRDEVRAHDIDVTRGGKHIQIDCVLPNGNAARVTMAGSPKNRDDCKRNAIRDVRRFVVGRGVSA